MAEPSKYEQEAIEIVAKVLGYDPVRIQGYMEGYPTASDSVAVAIRQTARLLEAEKRLQNLVSAVAEGKYQGAIAPWREAREFLARRPR